MAIPSGAPGLPGGSVGWRGGGCYFRKAGKIFLATLKIEWEGKTSFHLCRREGKWRRNDGNVERWEVGRG